MALIQPQTSSVQLQITLSPAQLKILKDFSREAFGHSTNLPAAADQFFKLACINAVSQFAALRNIRRYYTAESVWETPIQQQVIESRISIAAKRKAWNE